MDAADLRVFEAVSRLGAMSKAAIELNTVQSNVTSRIKALEDELRVTLFRRNSKGVELTEAGARLLPYAHDIAHLLVDARRAVADDGQPNGTLRIGTLETTAALRLSSFLPIYAASYPDVDLTLRTGTTCELIDLVLGRHIDGAFVCGPVAHQQLLSETIFEEELLVHAPPDRKTLNAAITTDELKTDRPQGRLFLSAASRGLAGAARNCRNSNHGVWNARGYPELRFCGAWHHALALGPGPVNAT